MTTRERAGALAGFALLAGYAAAHWFALVADPPRRALVATRRDRRPRRAPA